MKRALILCLFFTLSEIPGACATTYFPPLQAINAANSELTSDAINNYTSNLNRNPDVLAKDTFSNPNYNNPKINSIENSLYGHNYANQDISQRLSRLERSLFRKTFTNSTLSQRVENIILNFNQINEYPGISQDVITKMETKIFNRSYPQADTLSRIERLEQQIFGAAQSGDVTERYLALKTASSKYRMSADTYYPNPNQRGGLRGLAGNFGNMFGGTMTGFTPQISPLDNYNSYGNNYNNYGSNRSGYNPFASLGGGGGGYYRGVRTNRGYSDEFANFGSGTGVTILD